MKPFLAKGYAKRKLHTGNQSVQFDEEREVERPHFYSTIGVHLRFCSSQNDQPLFFGIFLVFSQNIQYEFYQYRVNIEYQQTIVFQF